MMLRLFIVLVSLLASIAPVRAQSASTQAEVLFRKGRDLMKAGKYGEACNAFETSQNLEPAVTTLLNIADCREKLGQLATALARFASAEKLARAATDDKTRALAKIAAAHIEKLEPRISKLEVAVAERHRITGLVVTRNGDPVPEAAWGVSLPVDGGTYRIAAKAPGREEWEKIVTIQPESDAVVVEVPALAEPAPPPSKLATPVQPESPLPPPPTRSDNTPLVVGAGAIVLLGASLAFDLWGNSTYDDAQAARDPQTYSDLWHSANDKRYIADGLLVAGVATGGVAAWLWWRERSTPAVVPVVAGDRVGIQIGGRW